MVVTAVLELVVMASHGDVGRFLTLENFPQIAGLTQLLNKIKSLFSPNIE
jgi:hypothetical protein